MITLSPPSDIWHTGIIHAPIEKVASTPSEIWSDLGITWLPKQAPFCFIADPFGIWVNGALSVFVEAYDYRSKRGHIDYYCFNADFVLTSHGTALKMPFHLSYPQIIADNGNIYMLPEAHQSGKLTLYRATHFPHSWEAVATILDTPAIDATLLQQDKIWHCYYSLPDAPLSAIYHASSGSLQSKFITNTKQQLINLKNCARMGGTPFTIENQLHLPLQNSNTTYGGNLVLLPLSDPAAPPHNLAAYASNSSSLRSIHLAAYASDSPSLRSIHAGKWSAPFSDGIHTLSASGNVTLFDVKRIYYSPMRHLINMQRRWRRLAHK